MNQSPQPRTSFEWPIYADATLAGLSVLVPVPLMDWVLEEHFRRRMPAAIARHSGQTLQLATIRVLNSSQRGCVATGVILLVQFPIQLLKRLSQKILYVLAIKEASDKLSYYWQRAFLLDYMLLVGHLTSVESTKQARDSMEQVIQATPAPFTILARAIIGNIHHVFSVLRRARHGDRDVLQPQQSQLRQQWGDYESFLQSLATKYEKVYRERMFQQQRARKT